MRERSPSLGALLVVCAACGGAPSAKPAAPAAATAAVPQPSPCAAITHDHDFDFWLGTWEVRSGGAIVGHNVIESGQSGCAVIEHWTAMPGHTGTSLNAYDPARKHWRQWWVDGSGEIVELEGERTATTMVLEGPYTHVDGTITRLRGTWTPNPDGTVRQYIEESKDGGATWAVWFDGMYARTH